MRSKIPRMKQYRSYAALKVFILVLCAVLFIQYCANAQSPKVPQHVSTYYQFWGTGNDSFWSPPVIITQDRYKLVGCHYFNLTDSNDYAWTGHIWKCMSCGGGSGTPGLPLNSVQFNRNNSFTGTDSMTYRKGLILRTNKNGGDSSNGIVFKPTDTTGNVLVIHMNQIDSRQGNFYMGTQLNRNVNFGNLLNDDDQVTTLGWNYNYSATQGKVNPNLPAWGWRVENNYPTGYIADSISYSEHHYSMFPVTTGNSRIPAEVRLLSWACQNGIGAVNHLYNNIHNFELTMYANALHIASGDSCCSQTNHTNIDATHFHQQGNIEAFNVANGDQAYTLNSNPVISLSNRGTDDGAIVVGKAGQRVSIYDTLELLASNVRTTIRASGVPLDIKGTYFDFIQDNAGSISELNESKSMLNLTSNSVAPKGHKLTRMDRVQLGNFTSSLTKADAGWSTTDTVTGTIYQWSGTQLVPIPGSAGWKYVQPSSGGSVQMLTAQIYIIDPAAPIAALTITSPAVSPMEGDEFEVTITQSVTAITWAGGPFGPAATTSTTGNFYHKFVATNGKWF